MTLRLLIGTEEYHAVRNQVGACNKQEASAPLPPVKELRDPH
jgi:hypothetical protein